MPNFHDTAVLALNPVAYWLMEETSGTALADATGHGHTLTISGSYSLNQPGLIFETSKSIRFTGGLAVTADNTSVAYDVNSFTLMAYIKHDGHTDDQRIMMRDFLGAIRPFLMILDWSNPGAVNQWQLQFHHQTAGGVQQLNGPLLAASTIYRIWMTYDGANIKIYVNGVQVATAARTGTTSTNDNNIGVAGATGNATLRYRGYLSRVAIFSGAVSAANIAIIDDLALNGNPPPNTPTGLDVDDETPVALTLNWTASTGDPDGYDVRINGGSPIDVGNVLEHEFTGLTPSTAYTLEVRAYNGGGDSAWASIGGTTLDLDAPTGLTVDPAVTTIELSWDAVTGADSYEVRLDGGTPLDVGAVLSFLFDELEPATLYTLEVRAVAGASFSGWASIEATTLEYTPFTVGIKVGDHEFTITSEDTIDPEDPIHVLDGLNIAWTVDESDPWPAQPGPGECTIGFYTGDVDNLEDVDINTPISIVLTDEDANVFGTFHGRVAQLDAQPIRRNAGLFTLYTVRGVGYRVDLDELPIVIPGEWPAEPAADRFARIVAAITEAGGPVVEPPANSDTAAFEALGAGTATAGALLAEHLRQVAIPGDYGPERYLLVPVVIADELDRFESVLLEKTVDAALLPGTLDVVGGLLTLVFGDPTADGIVDAGFIRLESPWTRLKYRAVNRVTVTGNTVTAEANRPGTPVRSTIGTTLTNAPAAQRMADMYLPDPAETNRWAADTLRLEAWLNPGTITPAWFADHREDPASTSVYVMPIAVVGIAPEINLAGSEAYAGELTNVSLTIAERRIVVDFSLRLQLPIGVGAESATWQWVEDEHPTITWEDVDPDLSWYEARLGRRS